MEAPRACRNVLRAPGGGVNRYGEPNFRVVWGRSIDRDAHLKGIRERSSYDASQNICARNAGTSSAR